MHAAAVAGLVLLSGLVGPSAGFGGDPDALVAEYDLSRFPEAATGRETLRGPGITAVYAPGLSVALVNGERVVLASPVSLVRGRLLLPSDLTERIRRLASPRRREAPRPAARRLGASFKIVLDPGHGGMHTGGKSRDGGLMEKDVVLDVCLRLRPLLEEMGAQVVMTRTADVHFAEDVDDDLMRRVAIANRERPDFFLSVHSNWVPGADARGFEVYVARHLEPGREGSRRMADEIRAQFRRHLDTEDRGIKEAGFKVIRLTDAPAALVELEFLSNARGARELGDPAHRQKLSELLAEAVRRYASRR